MIEATEYQCFRKLLEEVFEVFSGEKEAYKNYVTKDYEELIKDLDEVLKPAQGPSITTLKSHLKLKTRDNLPRITNLDLYCKYCRLKGSTWCKTDKWRLLLKENMNEGNVKEDKERKVNDEKEEKVKEVNEGDVKEKNEGKTNNTEKQKPITNIWYTSKPFKLRDFWRKNDEGSLFIEFDKKQIRFESQKTSSLLIKGSSISQIIHTKMPGDIANSWVRVIYEMETNKPKQAWFQDKNKPSGLSSMFGGSKKLYNLLYQLMNESKS